MTPARLVVVGNGMAGCRFVQEVLTRDPGRRLAITVVGDERGGAYNRLQLSNVLAGVTGADTIELAGRQWYADQGVTLRTGTAAVGIDRQDRRVRLADGTALRYDILVLATGSEPVLPPIDGLLREDGELLPGVVAFRTLDDCEMILRLAADTKRTRRAAVLGAGVLGLEAARGLAGRGLPVTLLQRGQRLMERQLDADASRLLTRTVRALGVDVRAGTGVRAVLQSEGKIKSLVLNGPGILHTDLLILACGVRPRVELARAAGLAVAVAVVVDDQLRSVTDASIFAIGECAEHRGQTHGLVAPCWAQARAAAQVITGSAESVSHPGPGAVTRLKAAGIELASLGEATTNDDDDDETGTGTGTETGDVSRGPVEVIRFVDSARGIYQKLVVRDGRLTGAILLGDTRTVGTITQLFDRGGALPADRASLLMVRRNSPVTVAQTPTTLPGRAVICQCNGITKSVICAAWQDGARDAAEVSARTRAMTGCGTCRDAVEGIVAWLAAADAESDQDEHAASGAAADAAAQPKPRVSA
jgi:assimilatory nitrate reductase electron transfer subunit